jgi:long-chain acyl-CoA synthetase
MTQHESSHENGGGSGTNGAEQPSGSEAHWTVSETLSGKRIMVTGTTGFLGKVYLSMLLRYHPDLDQIYLLIRPRSNQSAEERFFDSIAASAAMDPVRETYGEGYLEYVKDKVTPLAGDITEENLGIDEDEARALASRLDAVVNSAGLTNFNPNLENALEINALSQRNLLDFVRLGDNNASLMHVSTCFVAGNVSGFVPEEFPGPTKYPKYDDIGALYDAEREIEDCLAMIEHAKALAGDQEHQTQFEKEAREKMRAKNVDPSDEDAFADEVENLRWKWLRDRLSQEGRERASFWGWPNIYTYTKSLGERVLAAASDDVNLCVFRPAVVESAMEYPKQGWNEGINTTAPLLYLMNKGHRSVPTKKKVRFDAIPVDFVAGGMVAATAALIRGEHADVYQSGTSHLNPVTVSRLIELSTLANRQLRNNDARMPQWQKVLLNSLDGVRVDKSTFERRSAPGLKKAAQGLQGLLDKVPTKYMGGLGKAVKAVKSGAKQAERLTNVTEKVFELFMPFIHDNNFEFGTKNLEELGRKLPEAERLRYGSPVETIDWRHYWMDVHMPGLAEHVFPALDEKFSSSPRDSYTYDDLVELFDASTANFGQRVAMQHHDGRITERYTYADLKEYAERAVDALRTNGVNENTTALIVSENRPQWGMAYFGILKAGGVAVPVDPDSSAEELVNLMKSAHARVAILSEAVWERLGDELGELLAEEELPARLLHFGQLFSLALPETDAEPQPAVAETSDTAPAPPTDLMRATESGEPIASLIFTSGTTGQPKGVMLTHKNFTSLLASLQQTFDVDEQDGFLSVLPLHHTFEFACGFLMPLSKGATITYLEELSGEELTSALNHTEVSALIGVPALWQLLDRRIRNRLDDAPTPVAWGLHQLINLNTTLRDRLGLNVGETVFGAVHRAFGGDLRYLISGGAALPSDVLKTFYGLGFDLYEGYGLTEAAPVLTVNRPDKGFHPGKVGKALPGVEVDIADPNDDGVGEVIARGDNVMRGYLGLDEETERALDDGWLRTGDLGRIDDSGRLEIVGRQKEVIVTSAGKNVYPDELEDIYGACPEVEELSIVGLPDGSGSERVACLVRPDVDADATDEEKAEAEARIRDWFRVEGTRMANQKRIRVLRFWYDDFPRTATRKIKRRDVVDILQDLHEAEHVDEQYDEDEERE